MTAVARQGDQSIVQVARSSGVSESCLARWVKIADRDEGRAGTSPAGPAVGGLEAEILRRATAYFARDVLPQ